jgi:hypothetical protein
MVNHRVYLLYLCTFGTLLVLDRRCRILKVVLVRRLLAWYLGSGNLEGGEVGERIEKGEVSLQAT